MRQLACRVDVFRQFPRPGDYFRHSCSLQVVLKNEVWIEKVTDDQIEGGEIIGQVIRQFRTAGEKARERAIFDRANRISVETAFGEGGDMGIAEDFDPRSRIGVA